jgi:hypothetical protein
MPVTSQKNLPLVPSAAEQGFGVNQLTQQLADETAEEKRRRLLGLSPLTSSRSLATPPLSPATLSLFGAMGLGRGR